MGVTFIAKEGTYTAPATLTTKTITENGTYSAVDDSANGYSSVTVEVEGGGGSNGEFKIANITWINLPERFDDYDGRTCFLLIKTADGFEDYHDINEFSETLLQWDDEWSTPPKAIVTTKQPENVGDLAVWLQPYQSQNFSVVSGEAFVWNRGVIIYGDCTLTIS